MSWLEASDPLCTDCATTPAVETIIASRKRDIGGFSVGRLLPAAARRRVGPFVFFDHMGPADLAPGHGIDVRPHPHINLATVTYLFEGGIVHRDSVGSVQPIQPGAINWMTAGRGIVHSERTGPGRRKKGSRLHGLQLWVALPKAHEETEPEFRHYPAASLPELEADGARIRVLAGSAYGAASPVQTLSPLFYAEATIPAGSELPVPAEYEERAAYVVEGIVRCGAERVEASHMIVFAARSAPVLRAESAARVMLLGGAARPRERPPGWD